MAKEEIIEKLKVFLLRHSPFDEESQIVYLMVEIRKILAQEESNGDYPLLKFYSDWAVHHKKDRITPEIRQIMETMYETTKNNIENPALIKAGSPVMQFAYMDELGREIKLFLENHNVDPSLAQEESVWIEFVKLLVKVLENQPIIFSDDDFLNIKSFSFESANTGCVIGVLKFKQPIGKFSFYTFKNIY